MDQFRNLIEQGALQPVQSADNPDSFKDPNPDADTDAFTHAAEKAAAEQQQKKDDAKRAENQAAPQAAKPPEAAAPETKPPEAAPADNPYLAFGKRI